MEKKSFMSKVGLFVKRFAGTNFIWFIMNLPIVVLGFLLVTIEGLPEINIYLILIIVLAPFVLFPATAGMFGVVRKFIMGEDIEIGPTFFTNYRDNFARSVAGGILFTFCWVLFGYLYLLLADVAYIFVIISAIIAIVLFMFMLNYISMTVHMETPFVQALKNAFLFTISGNVLTIGVGLISAAILYVNFNIAPILIPFFSGSLIAYLAFWMFYKLVIGVQSLHDKQAREAQEATETIDVADEDAENTEETLVIEETVDSEETYEEEIQEGIEEDKIE